MNSITRTTALLLDGNVWALHGCIQTPVLLCCLGVITDWWWWSGVSQSRKHQQKSIKGWMSVCVRGEMRDQSEVWLRLVDQWEAWTCECERGRRGMQTSTREIMEWWSARAGVCQCQWSPNIIIFPHSEWSLVIHFFNHHSSPVAETLMNIYDNGDVSRSRPSEPGYSRGRSLTRAPCRGWECESLARGPGWQSISLTSPEPVSQSAFSLEKITVSNACKHYINTEWDEIKEGKEGWISFLWLSIRLMKNDISTHSLWIHNILRPRLGWFRLNDNPIHSIRRELSEVGNQIICREYSSRKWILGWCSISAAAPT